jgi:hypothetical protein
MLATNFRSHAYLIIHELSQHIGYSPPPLIDRMAEDGQKIIKIGPSSKRDSSPPHSKR